MVSHGTAAVQCTCTVTDSLGIVVTTSPTCNLMNIHNTNNIPTTYTIYYNYLYNIVVFPAPSKPRIRILISFEPHKPENNRLKKLPGLINRMA